MPAKRTYLDWNATAPLRATARASAIAALCCTGNPSSPHAEGRRARALVEEAREKVALLVGAEPAEVVFTSGATEANNTVLAGGWEAILLSPTEHDSLLAAAHASGARLHFLAIDGQGVVDAAGLAAQLAGLAGRRALLSLQIANNETGVVQPLGELAAMAKRHGLFVHSDAVQGAGRLAIDIATRDLDFVSLSAHKIGGPAGSGALIVRRRAELAPLLKGGGQERRRRAGTENIAGIAGFGAAAAAARSEVDAFGNVLRLRDWLESEVRAMAPEAVILGAGTERLPNTSCLALPGTRAETLVIALDLAGIAVSAGAACSSGKVASSHVLRAMGVADEIAAAAIRVSLGATTREADIARFLAAWDEAALRTRRRLVA
jgi:cysteine desulfurase